MTRNVRVAPKAYFHGTSSRALTMITREGLNPNLPDAAGSNPRYLFSGNVLTALNHARKACERTSNRDNPVLVFAQFPDLSKVPDDEAFKRIESCFQQACGRVDSSSLVQTWINTRLRANGWWGSYRDYYTRFHAALVRAFKIDEARRQDSMLLHSVIESLFTALLQNHTSGLYHGGSDTARRAFYDAIRSTLSPDNLERITVQNRDGSTCLSVPPRWLPASPQRSQSLLSSVLARFLGLASDPFDRGEFQRVRRLLTPLKLRGRNRITGIVEFLPAGACGTHTRQTVLRLHYGRVPPEFLGEWRSRMGAIDDLVIVSRDPDSSFSVTAFQGDLNGPEIGERPNEWVIEDLYKDDAPKLPAEPPAKTAGKKPPPGGKKAPPPSEDAESDAPDEAGEAEAPQRVGKHPVKPKKKQDDEEEAAPKNTDEESEADADTGEDDEAPAQQKKPAKKGKSVLTPERREKVKGKGGTPLPDKESEADDEGAAEDEDNEAPSGKKTLLTPQLRKLLKA